MMQNPLQEAHQLLVPRHTGQAEVEFSVGLN
jgi:hypothetical protein